MPAVADPGRSTSVAHLHVPPAAGRVGWGFVSLYLRRGFRQPLHGRRALQVYLLVGHDLDHRRCNLESTEVRSSKRLGRPVAVRHQRDRQRLGHPEFGVVVSDRKLLDRSTSRSIRYPMSAGSVSARIREHVRLGCSPTAGCFRRGQRTATGGRSATRAQVDDHVVDSSRGASNDFVVARSEADV